MELKFWIYLIIGVIWFLAKALKKAKPEAGDSGQAATDKSTTPQSRTGSAPSKPLTFEELLREISESKPSVPKPVEATKPVTPVSPYSKVVDYDDNLQDEKQDLEDVGYDYRKRDEIYNVYEDAKREAFYRPSLEETMKVGDTVMTYGRFKEFEQQKQRNLIQEYLGDFNDREGLKKAVVLSEIMQKKF